MKVSGRARLAWANGSLEEAADVIVSGYLRELARRSGWTTKDLLTLADELDPR